MNKTPLIYIFAALVGNSEISMSQTIKPLNYKVYNKETNKGISIQMTSLEAIPGLNQSAIKKENTAMLAASDFFLSGSEDMRLRHSRPPMGI